jgi:hypothetical protein
MITCAKLDDLERALFVLCHDPELSDLWSRCSGPPIVLGTWNAPTEKEEEDVLEISKELISDKKQTANFWVQVEAVDSDSVAGGVVKKEVNSKKWLVPRFKDVYCCGFLYKTTSQIIFYKKPTSYLTTRPFTFDFSLIGQRFSDDSKKDNSKSISNSDLDFILQQINSSEKVGKLLNDVLQSDASFEQLFAPAPKANNFNSFSNPSPIAEEESDASKANDTPRTMLRSSFQLEDIDQQQDSDSLFNYMRQRARKYSMRRYRSPTIDALMTDEYFGIFPSTSMISSDSSSSGARPTTSFKDSLLSREVFRSILRIAIIPVHVLLLLIRIILALFSKILNTSLPKFLGGEKLKNRSGFGRQLDWRIQEICSWPYMWLRTRGRWKNDAYSSSAFICFWGSLVQILGDFVLGPIFALFLHRYSTELLTFFHYVGQILHVDVLRMQIDWLMGLPAGMKLNENLNHTLGSTVLYAIDLWNTITTAVTPFEPVLIRICSIIAIFGTSLLLATFSDILSGMTFHIDFIHSGFSRLYSLELSALSSLWKLFRGKKRNILRGRIDSCSYDMDQLLLGTILFTLVFFLFPTITIYYIFFSMVRFSIIITQALIWFLLAFMNYFPLFAAIMYVFDSERLPGGIWFEHFSQLTDLKASALNLRIVDNNSGELKSAAPKLILNNSSYSALSDLLSNPVFSKSKRSCTYLILRVWILIFGFHFLNYRFLEPSSFSCSFIFAVHSRAEESSNSLFVI